MLDTAEESRFLFGVFERDMLSGELCKAGTRVKLQEQPLRVLIALLNSPERS
jgi:DNA-binding winged helix-turn-helix (wHTH) protein